MRIGRKDSKKKTEESAQSSDDSPEASAAEAARQKELEQKYSAPKAFDWSKVGSLGKRVKEEKRKEKEEVAKQEAEAPPVQGRAPLKKEHAIAAGSAIALSLIFIIYSLMPSGDLGMKMSVEQTNQLKAAEQREDRALLSKLEQEFGSDHPQVKQMKMELGDSPFPRK